MLVEMAIGDAFGAGREFVQKPKRPAAWWNDGKTYLKHPKFPQMPGCYTDDTQMAIAMAEFMLSGKLQTPRNLAHAFVNAFIRDPRQGYAPGFYNFLVTCSSKSDPAGYFLRHIQPGSNKAGGAMRAGPCGLLDDPEKAVDLAMWQASLTHATWEGMAAAGASALLVWACRNEPDTILAPLQFYFPQRQWDDPWFGWVGNEGIPAVHAAATAVQEETTLTGILKRCVEFGGDVDTVAAIALSAAAWHPEIDNDLDDALYHNLEGGDFGLGYLIVLDQKITAAYPMPDSIPISVVKRAAKRTASAAETAEEHKARKEAETQAEFDGILDVWGDIA